MSKLLREPQVEYRDFIFEVCGGWLILLPVRAPSFVLRRGRRASRSAVGPRSSTISRGLSAHIVLWIVYYCARLLVVGAGRSHRP